MTSAPTDFITRLKTINGHSHVLTTPDETLRFRKGFRFGLGDVLAVVSPGSLIELWRTTKACVENGKIIIMQAANTGLTGGSTPDGSTYDRDIVIISTLRMRTIHVIENGQQVVCLPGSTLDQLENRLTPLGREPHSVIGSSCIGASVFGGVSNNSGGALIQRGPAYTEMALFGRVDENGELKLVNHLGIDLGDDPEEILQRVEAGNYPAGTIHHTAAQGHDGGYITHIRDVDADTPARFNADTRRLFEGAGCAGKVILFAVRLDTFPADRKTAVFYIGTNDTNQLENIRRHILKEFPELPVSGEYLHRDAFDIAEKYGKDTFLAIRLLGTRRLPKLFALKSKFDVFCEKLGFLPSFMSDRLMQAASNLFPKHLSPRMYEFRERYEHHLILKVGENLIDQTRSWLQSWAGDLAGDYFECSPDEASRAMLHRFAAAGAAIRYRAIHQSTTEDIVAIDVALRRNDQAWFETLPDDIENDIVAKLYYGHFFCHVMHQDYVVRKGIDCLDLEHRMLKLLDKRGARYPAEHNFGHLYQAPDEVLAHYRSLDPCNCLNPGIGQATKTKNWKAESV
ncbi:MAG: D-lactate dehydrogenase [Acetobacter sp.]|jgi:D-lactate dehydrogenase|nr:D-lactate dehydrogenase [Acetobacter sp.]